MSKTTSEARVKAAQIGVMSERCGECGGVIYKIDGVWTCPYCPIPVELTLEIAGQVPQTFRVTQEEANKIMEVGQ